MNPFDKYNPTKPSGLVFQTEDKDEVVKVAEFLHCSGYHPHLNFSPVFPQQFEPGFVFRVFVPGGEARAASEIMMRYEHGEISI
jgi:hypothetical protein